MKIIMGNEIYKSKNVEKEKDLMDKVSKFAEEVIMSFDEDDEESILLFLGALQHYGQTGIDLLIEKFGINTIKEYISLEKEI